MPFNGKKLRVLKSAFNVNNDGRTNVLGWLAKDICADCPENNY
jgi:hypothetical protein